MPPVAAGVLMLVVCATVVGVAYALGVRASRRAQQAAQDAVERPAPLQPRGAERTGRADWWGRWDAP